jgi:hypothetical protein
VERLNLVFSQYEIGKEIGFEDILLLLDLDTVLSEQRYARLVDLSLRILEQIRVDWFGPMCSVGLCMKVTGDKCNQCLQLVCSKQCLLEHTAVCIGKKNKNV